MKRVSCAALAALLLWCAPATAQSLTGPATQIVLTPEADYATAKWGDAWDMDRRTDIGFLTWGSEAAGNIGSKTMLGCTPGTTTGCSGFRFTASNLFAQIFLLDTWQRGSAIINKVGAARPIDTTKFKYLLVKMKVQTGVSQSDPIWSAAGRAQMQVTWSRNTIYYDPTQPNSGPLVSVTSNDGSPFINPGVVLDLDGVESDRYRVYAVRMDQLHWWNPSTHPVPPVLDPASDLGLVWGQNNVTGDSLYLTLPNSPELAARFGNIDIAWARLTTFDATNQKTVSWTGGGTYDIVVSETAVTCSNYTVLAETQTSGAFSFDFSALAPGTYYVGLRASKADGPDIVQSGIATCSAGNYVVPNNGSLRFTSPTDEGSTDDFATTFLGNAWDFDATTDADEIHDMPGALINQSLPAERPDGSPLGNIRVLQGTSIAGSDAYIHPLFYFSRGLDNRIDTSRYRILTYDYGLNTQRNILAGSVSRVIWHINGDWTRNASGAITRSLENVSDDLVVRHLHVPTQSSNYILDRLQVDMKDRRRFPLETDNDPAPPFEASPSRAGWTNLCLQPWCTVQPTLPGADALRIRFHEFPGEVPVYIKQVKLAALERTTGSYTISWAGSLPDVGGLPTPYTSPVVKLYASRQTVSPPSAVNQPTVTGVELTPTAQCDRQLTDGGAPDSNLILLNGAGGTALSAGSFVWNVNDPLFNALAEDSEVYICGVVQGTLNAATRFVAASMTEFPIVVKRSFVSKPRINFDRSTLRFSGVLSNDAQSFLSKTPDQVVGITQVGAGTATWRVESIQDISGAAVNYISVTPSSGTGSGTTRISLLTHPFLPRCTAIDGLAVVIKIVSDGTTQNEPQFIRAYVTIRPQAATGGCASTTTPPVGVFDTPFDGAGGVIGSIPVTGWAMDDVAVSHVQIWRNCVETIDRPAGACTSSAPGQQPNFVFIGNAAFLAGARPDVESFFPNSPIAYRAGWGYLMATNALPHLTSPVAAQGGQGQFTLYAWAVDFEGNYTALGQKIITLDNDSANIPFGAIDTPDQGGTVPGSSPDFSNPNAYPDFGWGMTQPNKCITTSALSSYRVYIDGVSRTLTPGVNWVSGLFRPDLAAAYPGRCNSGDALAVYYINAAALGLSSGLHTIGWDIIDNGNNVAGIGSRFFNLITSSLTTAEVGPKLGFPSDIVEPYRLAQGEVTAERQQTGYPVEALPDVGGRRTLIAREVERVQVSLPQGSPASRWEAYQVGHNKLELLPMGSTFHADTGMFYWQPVAGYVGNYDFVFVRRGSDGQQERLPLRIAYQTASGTSRNVNLDSTAPGSVASAR